ncbi:F0F1 ATP synthase subunit delta [Paenirhodobacter enshiensis]|uniref:ATP synthase subunit delta n=1 Tax=Paenirhodobacter enshiensis TaxID=1105367 RepID=A0A086Y4B9_9RHOB|nr:F0F1 ATP synthase subunit delta [Paenirhodobacter enshiensis]KFI29119.1 ATP synthase F0F1 subunit delta [Paenirhodobacter enshiensis]
MSEPASISAAIAGRYATAIFDLAKELGLLPALEVDVDALSAALASSAELREMVASPLYGRGEQASAIAAVSRAMHLSVPVTNGLALIAEKRRLFILPQLLKALSALIAEAKGIETAEVVSAAALSDAQSAELAAALSASTGKTVKLNVAIDDSLIGGMIVRLGSRMIDTSVRAKLASLQNAMKEVG